VHIAFKSVSIHKTPEVKEYAGTAPAKSMFSRKWIKAFNKVATAESAIGRKTASKKKDPRNSPQAPPINVRTNMLSPKGDAERKSKSIPEKNPVSCPVIAPFR
jgi:hypothetical protein